MRAIRHDEMPVDVEGWLASPRVRRMTTSERGMFFQLLCEAWADTRCSLPNDEGELKFLSGGTEGEWAAGKDRVLAMFELQDGRLVNGKQREILEEQNGRLALAKANRERVAKHRASKNGELEVEEHPEPPVQNSKPGKPTLEEVKLAAAKAGLPDREAEKFFNHYESCGWKVGKNPMKSLGGAIGGWKLRWEEGGRKTKAPVDPGQDWRNSL